MDTTVRFALVTKPNDATRKPFTFDSIEQLATSIQRRRGAATLQMMEAKVYVQGEDQPRPGVSVWKIDQGAEQADYLGWAYLDGAGREALRRALHAIRPEAPMLRLARAA